MNTIAFPFARALAAATVGDTLRITFAGRSSTSPDEVRDVRITAIRDGYVYTTSGKVRPGHFEGGLVRVHGDAHATYSPTLAQPARNVRALAIVRA